jgi:hypothetical protein
MRAQLHGERFFPHPQFWRETTKSGETVFYGQNKLSRNSREYWQTVEHAIRAKTSPEQAAAEQPLRTEGYDVQFALFDADASRLAVREIRVRHSFCLRHFSVSNRLIFNSVITGGRCSKKFPLALVRRGGHSAPCSRVR